MSFVIMQTFSLREDEWNSFVQNRLRNGVVEASNGIPSDVCLKDKAGRAKFYAHVNCLNLNPLNAPMARCSSRRHPCKSEQAYKCSVIQYFGREDNLELTRIGQKILAMERRLSLEFYLMTELTRASDHQQE